MKASFQAEWLALQSKDVHRVLEKINLLANDPTPDAKVKKQLKYVGRRLCRIRAGDFRVFYTYDDKYVSVLALRRREDDTYDDERLDAEFLGGPAMDDKPSSKQLETVVAPEARKQRSLPRPIDTELLTNLRIPAEWHATLLKISDEDALLSCTGVPDDWLLRVHAALFERRADELLAEREYVVQTPDDLIRFKEGELLGFLLRLDPEQEKFVKWSVNSAGPTLVKGNPGTGKSTVAMYRVRAMVEKLASEGVQNPRILFTTYTNALVAFSRQLLEHLLTGTGTTVDVRTADAVVREIVAEADGPPRLVQELRPLMEAALKEARLDGTSLQQRAQRQTLERLGLDYVREEILGVIDARRLDSFDAYREAARPGRRVPLGESQRRAVWAVRDALHRELARRREHTWQTLRARAATLVEEGRRRGTYDAVVVDEAQDLDPSCLQVLVGLGRAPGVLFLTADANQSIYGSGFRWSDVHAGLQFKGRTGVLRTNHRSTSELGEAARAYLSDGQLDDEDTGTPTYEHSGPFPVVRDAASTQQEAELLERFIRSAASALRLTTHAAAILAPTQHAGERIARELRTRSLEAYFMSGQQLDLGRPCVKVLTLKSAKGLEFPIVALAGFTDGSFPVIAAAASEEEEKERLAQERRTLYVAMTRAMRALLVVRPEGGARGLLTRFDPSLWNCA